MYIWVFMYLCSISAAVNKSKFMPIRRNLADVTHNTFSTVRRGHQQLASNWHDWGLQGCLLRWGSVLVGLWVGGRGSRIQGSSVVCTAYESLANTQQFPTADVSKSFDRTGRQSKCSCGKCQAKHEKRPSRPSLPHFPIPPQGTVRNGSKKQSKVSKRRQLIGQRGWAQEILWQWCEQWISCMSSQ